MPSRRVVLQITPLLLLLACASSSGSADTPLSADAGAGGLSDGGTAASPTEAGAIVPTDGTAPPEFWDASGIHPRYMLVAVGW